MYTEDEAKTKFCPFKAISFGIHVPRVTEVPNRQDTWDACIASECMMWIKDKRQPDIGDCAIKNKM